MAADRIAPDDFDSQRLTVDAGINRLVLAGSSGIPDRLVGRQAHDILSADSIAALCADHGVAVRREAIADDLGAALRAADPYLRRAARDAAAEVGLRLACVLATLRDPATALAQGRNPRRRACLRHWTTVDEVHLAGGLLAGRVGPVVVDETNAAIGRIGVPTRAALMPWPAWAGLIGAARRLGTRDGEVLAMDFGGSRVKSALVRVPRGGTAELTPLTATRVPFEPLDHPPRQALEDLLTAVLVSAAHDVRNMGASVGTVAIAVACYLDGDGRCAASGVYGNLPDLADRARRRRMEDLFGRPVDIGVFHDGTAAAASIPGPGGSPGAVLALGSALGVGFPLPAGLPPWHTLIVRQGPPGGSRAEAT